MIAITCPVRNEDWILALSARAMLMWADHVVFLDHACTDNSAEILREIAVECPGRVTILKEESPVWEEMRHRQRLLDAAREVGGTHICLVDADEVLSGNCLPHIRDWIERCPANATMQLPWLCLRGSRDLVHASGVWGEQDASMAFVDAPHLGWSAASRSGYDFHQRAPMGREFFGYRPVGNRGGGLMHLQFVSERRLKAKQALYQATEVLRWPGRETPDQIRQKYSLSVYGAHSPTMGGFDLGPVPFSWWGPYEHLMHHYRPDDHPWQLTELRRLVAEHGMEKFEGLDFFGMV